MLTDNLYIYKNQFLPLLMLLRVINGGGGGITVPCLHHSQGHLLPTLVFGDKWGRAWRMLHGITHSMRGIKSMRNVLGACLYLVPS